MNDLFTGHLNGYHLVKDIADLFQDESLFHLIVRKEVDEVLKASQVIAQTDVTKAYREYERAKNSLQSVRHAVCSDKDQRVQVRNCCRQQIELLAFLVDLMLRIRRQEIQFVNQILSIGNYSNDHSHGPAPKNNCDLSTICSDLSKMTMMLLNEPENGK